MESNQVNYALLFADMRRHLLAVRPTATIDITKEIKEFFRSRFSSTHNVLCSHATSSEYLTDILVSTFEPKTVLRQRTLELIPSEVNVLLAAESELGGVGASSAYGVMKNVVEDYLKLLIIRCQYRVMIFTSLPYANEVEHVLKRVELLRSLYQRTAGLSSGVLLDHLCGSQQTSSQVQALESEESIRGFEISADGLSSKEIDIRAIDVSAA